MWWELLRSVRGFFCGSYCCCCYATVVWEDSFLLRRVASANARVFAGSLFSMSTLTFDLPNTFSQVMTMAGRFSQCLTVSSSSLLAGQAGLSVWSILFLQWDRLKQCPDLSWAINAASFLHSRILSFFLMYSLYVSLTIGWKGSSSLILYFFYTLLRFPEESRVVFPSELIFRVRPFILTYISTTLIW
jgi:hypothetical protein